MYKNPQTNWNPKSSLITTQLFFKSVHLKPNIELFLSLWPCFPAIHTFLFFQPRPVAGFRGTVRYASINAHKNKVSMNTKIWLSTLSLWLLLSTLTICILFYRKWVAMMTCGPFSTCWWNLWLVSCPGEKLKTKYERLLVGQHRCATYISICMSIFI